MEFHEKKTRNFAIFNIVLIIGSYLDVELNSIKIPFLDYQVNAVDPKKLQTVLIGLYTYSFMRYVQESFEEMGRKGQRDEKKAIVGLIGKSYVNYRNRNLEKQANNNNQIVKVEFAIDGKYHLKEKFVTYYNKLGLPQNNLHKKSIKINGSDWFMLENPPFGNLTSTYSFLTKVAIYSTYLGKNTKAFDHFLPFVLLIINLYFLFLR